MQFVFLFNTNLKRAKNVGTNQQVLAKVVDGMRGVTNEKYLEASVMGQQASVEDVVPLVPSEIVEEEQVEVGEDIEKTFKIGFDKIEMDLEITILMVEEQENVNEDGEPHAHIDGGDIAIELHLL